MSNDFCWALRHLRKHKRFQLRIVWWGLWSKKTSRSVLQYFAWRVSSTRVKLKQFNSYRNMPSDIHLMQPLWRTKRSVWFVRQWQLQTHKLNQTFTHQDNLRSTIHQDITKELQNILIETQNKVTYWISLLVNCYIKKIQHLKFLFWINWCQEQVELQYTGTWCLHFIHSFRNRELRTRRCTHTIGDARPSEPQVGLPVLLQINACSAGMNQSDPIMQHKLSGSTVDMLFVSFAQWNISSHSYKICMLTKSVAWWTVATLKRLRSNSISYSSDKMICNRKSSKLKKCDRWMKTLSSEFALNVKKHCMQKL